LHLIEKPILGHILSGIKSTLLKLNYKKNMQKFITQLFLALLACSIIACSNDSTNENDAGTKNNKATPVTVSKAQSRPIENSQQTIGTLEGLINPTIAAEVAARVINVAVNIGQEVKQGQLIATLDATDFSMQRNEAQAEVERIQALLENQIKTVARNQALVNKNFISQNAVDNDIAQQNVLKRQLDAAKARVGSVNHSSSKSRIVAPVSGIIEKKLVDTGDYVRVGDPIVQIVSKQRLRAHLPFPEYIGAQLKPGLKVRLSTPTSPNTIETEIKELKAVITEGNRTIDAIADINNAPGWQPGASVTGVVILDELPAAMMVPEQSVVLRPAGEVVYVVRNKLAHQVIVKTGLRQNGLIEVVSGLKANELVVVDGAGFLTDNAPVKISK
jgi:membrane fusion protein, multidrug efflux system